MGMGHLDKIVYILEVVIGFGLLVFVHELGHFLMAKWVGVRVLKFSLGFGPKLFGFTRGDTEYLVSAIPLGGYVKMAGESLADPSEGREDEFFKKSPGQRALIILAGPAMNMIFAVPAAILMYLIGINQPSTLCDVVKNSPAYQKDLKDGIRVLAVNDEPVLSFPEMRMKIFLAAPGAEIQLRYLEKDEKENPKTVSILPRGESKDIGLMPQGGMTIYEAEPGSPAQNARISRGDRIVAIHGKKIEKWNELEVFVRDHPDQKVLLDVERPIASKDSHPVYEPYQVEVALGAKQRYDLGLDLKFTLFPLIGNVRPNSPAEIAGLKPGDFIVSINGKPTESWQNLVEEVSPSADKELELAVRRNNEILRIKVTPKREDGHGIIGIEQKGDLAARLEGFWLKDSPAKAAGLLPGDFIVAAGGKEMGKLGESGFLQWIHNSGGQPLNLLVYRPVPADKFFEEKSVQITPNLVTVGYLGLQQGAETVLRRYAFGLAVKEGLLATHSMTRDTGLSLYRLFTGGISWKMIGGPVGISTALYYKAREGFAEFVHLVFILSLNLGLLNLLPIPILDGGHLALLLAEKLKGSPVKEKTMEVLQYVGLALLVALVIFATRNDILNFYWP